MQRDLWTVLVDRRPIAVIAAASRSDAWHVVAALADHDDLPPDRHWTALAPCPPDQAAVILEQATALNIADRFIAYLKGGAFLTFLGGLALPVLEAA